MIRNIHNDQRNAICDLQLGRGLRSDFYDGDLFGVLDVEIDVSQEESLRQHEENSKKIGCRKANCKMSFN